MRTRTDIDDWRRWSVTALGALLCGVVVGVVSVTSLRLTILEVAVPFLVALAVTAYGGWLVRSDVSPDGVGRIALWSVAGAAVIGSFAVWEMYIHLIGGEPVVASLHELLLGATEGAAVGGLVGFYDARRLEQHRETRRVRGAIAASIDGVAILDEDERYTTVNQAHAEIYGYDDPAAFVGESWRMCYTEAQLETIEEEAFPELRAEGHWRGELEGLRRDGTSFPQEVSLTAMDDGGLVCVVRDITERRRDENRRQSLHSATHELLSAESSAEITAELLSVADDTLGKPLTAVWVYDAATDRLVPSSATDRTRRFVERAGLEELPALEPGSTEMDIFHGDAAVLVDEYDSLEGGHLAELPLGAVLFVPLGDHALVGFGAPEPAAIDESDRFLAEVLVSNATAAMDRVERERELASREQRLQTIVENAPVILFAIDGDRRITLQVGKGLDRVGVEQNQMVGATVDEVFGDSPTVTDAIDRSFAGEPVDVTVDLWGRIFQVWYQPIETDGEVSNVIGVAMDVTESRKRERAIRALHDATREMMGETDRETISEIAVATAQNVLDLPVSTIWLRGDEPRLTPVAWSDPAMELFDEMPVFEPGESIAWQVHEEGEARVYDDVRSDDERFNPETAMRSELLVPIGEYGVLASGSEDPGLFDDADVLLARLLAANTSAALDRAEREDALQRQTDQMEFFNSILRHDVLNGMTVIRARAEFLTDELDGQPRRDAETIVDWSNDVVTIIQRVRTVLETLTGTGDPQLEAVDLSDVLQSEVDRVQGTYPEVAFRTDVPEGVRVEADELLGEVLGNVIANAIDHNDTDGLCVSVTVDDADEADGFVTVRVADDGRGVPDDAKEAIFRRDETGHAKSTGSGFGLFFVDSMVAEYGGEIRVEDNQPQGAAFVIELPTP